MLTRNNVILTCCLLALASCSQATGQLITHTRYPFPNSDVTPVAKNPNVSVDVSHTYFIWQTPPLQDLYDQVTTQALNGTGGSMLTNTKWVTTTTVYPFPVPVYGYDLHMEGVVVDAKVFVKKIH